MYACKAKAIVHLHSHYSVAVSVLRDIDPNSVLPPLDRILRDAGRPAAARTLLPPWRSRGRRCIRELAGDHAAVLLANHGPVVSGDSLEAAVYATEELEETARLFLSLYGKPVRPLEEKQIEELRRVFGAAW